MFDLRTLALMMMMSALVCSLTILMVWRLVPQERSLRDWTAGVMLIAASSLLLGLRGIIPDFISIVVANTALVLGIGFVYVGTRRLFELAPGRPWHWLAAAATALACIVFTYFTHNLPARLVAISLAILPFYAACGWVFWQQGTYQSMLQVGFKGKAIDRFSALVFMLGVLLFLVRGMTAFRTDISASYLSTSSVIVVAPYFYAILFNVWMTVMLTLKVGTMLRRKLAQALDHAEAVNRKLAQALDFNETIIHNSPLAIGVYAAGGQCVLANDAYAELVGATPDALLAQNFYSIAAWQRSGTLDDCLAALACQRPQRREFNIVTSFGKEIWVEHRILPTRLNGEPHLLIQFFDLTERKKIAQRMENLVAEQKAILENDLIGIATVKDRTLVWANPALEKILGYAAGELSGAAAHLCHPDEASYLAFGEAAYPVLAAGCVYRTQWELACKDGRRIWVDISGAMLAGASGESLWAFVDISALLKSEAQMKEAQRIAHLGSWERDLVARTLVCSDEMFRIYSIDAAQLGADYANWLRTIHDEDRELTSALFKDSLRNRLPLDMRHRVIAPDGQIKYVHVRGEHFYAENGTPLRSAGTAQDVTQAVLQEIALKASEERLRTIADYTYDWEYWQGIEGEMIYVSPACLRVSGYAQQEFYADPGLCERIVHPDDAPLYAAYLKNLTHQLETDLTFRIVRKDGQVRWITHGCRAVFAGDGRPLGRRVNNRDSTDLKEAERQAYELAYFDPLTDLPNRRMLLDRLDHGVSQAKRFQRSLAVMFLDLDQFKQINDTFGHNVGDSLLKEVAKRLAGCVRSGDTVSRPGGDEFIIVLAEIAHAADAALVAEKIIQAVGLPMQIDQQVLHVTTSIGIAVYSVNGTDDAQTLMKKADQAMYAAKNDGRNAYRLFEEAAVLAS